LGTAILPWVLEEGPPGEKKERRELAGKLFTRRDTNDQHLIVGGELGGGGGERLQKGEWKEGGRAREEKKIWFSEKLGTKKYEKFCERSQKKDLSGGEKTLKNQGEIWEFFGGGGVPGG